MLKKQGDDGHREFKIFTLLFWKTKNENDQQDYNVFLCVKFVYIHNHSTPCNRSDPSERTVLACLAEFCPSHQISL